MAVVVIGLSCSVEIMKNEVRAVLQVGLLPP
jgi:hypothetical protein